MSAIACHRFWSWAVGGNGSGLDRHAGNDVRARWILAVARLVPTRANGQLAFGHYSWRDEANAFVRHAITVLSLRHAEIEQITFFRSTDAFTGFDLPEQIAP